VDESGRAEASGSVCWILAHFVDRVRVRSCGDERAEGQISTCERRFQLNSVCQLKDALTVLHDIIRCVFIRNPGDAHGRGVIHQSEMALDELTQSGKQTGLKQADLEMLVVVYKGKGRRHTERRLRVRRIERRKRRENAKLVGKSHVDLRSSVLVRTEEEAIKQNQIHRRGTLSNRNRNPTVDS